MTRKHRTLGLAGAICAFGLFAALTGCGAAETPPVETTPEAAVVETQAPAPTPAPAIPPALTAEPVELPEMQVVKPETSEVPRDKFECDGYDLAVEAALAHAGFSPDEVTMVSGRGSAAG